MAKKISSKKTTQRKKTSSKIRPILRNGFFQANWKQCIVLAIFIAVIYVQSYDYEFVLDDKIVITENEFTKNGINGIGKILTTESMTGYFGQQKDLIPGARYRPLSLVTHAIEYSLFGSNSTVGHIVNMVLYFLVCILLFRILNDLLQKYNPSSSYFSLALIASLLYTIHPLHTEVVANIKGRDEIMSFLFSLFTLYYVIKSVDKKSLWYCIPSVGSFFLALLSKENAITFLAIIPLCIYYFSKYSLKRIFFYCLPLFITLLIYLVLRYQIIGYLLDSGKEVTNLMNNPFVEMSLSQKYATIAYTLGIYVKLSFFPHPLTHDYYPYHIPIMNWASLKSLISLAAYLMMIGVALMGLQKKTLTSFCIFFYMASLSISSNIVFNVGTFMNERFLFVPSLAACVILAYLIGHGIPKKFPNRGKQFSLFAVSLFVIAFTVKAFTKVPAWENTLSLNTQAVKVSKNSARANTFMSTALYNKIKADKAATDKYDRLAGAYLYADRATEIVPGYMSANLMKAGIAADRYQIDRDLDNLLNIFREVATIRPDLPFLHDYFEYLGKVGADPQRLINFYFKMGYQVLFREKGNYRWALKYIEYGLQINPNSMELNDAMGEIYEQLGDQAKAQTYFNKVLQRNTQ